MYQNGQVIGAVEVFADDSEKAHINNTINELKDLALSDALTSLPNRRYIDAFLTNRLIEYENLEIPFAIAMIDIDHFKIFNDTFGHDVGDLVLKMVSQTMKNAIRGNDMIGRWGGEEFLVGLVAVHPQNLVATLDKVRTLVEKSALPGEKDAISVTVSVGATMVQKNDTMDSIVKRADDALYISKNSGRNRTTIL
jgi:diguanylate cyclase (GGDEF)-like protein